MHNFKERRHRLLATLDDQSAVILFSGSEIKRSADSVYDFSVNRNFYYLTGIKQEQSIVVLTKSGDEINETIFTLAFDKVREVWTGRRLTSSEATKISNIKTHADTETFAAFLEALLPKVKTVYIDLELGITTHINTLTTQFADEIGENGVKVKNIYDAIVRLRMVKDAYEVKLIEESIKLTNDALQHAIKTIKPGVYEYEVAADFEHKIKQAHGELGFSTIAASGANGVILHYPNLDAKLNEGEFILLDLGGHNNMYTADISRTIPITNNISALHKTIYEIVLACNKAVIKFIKPGKTLLDLQNYTKTFLKEKLVAAELMSDDEDITNYYYHGVSHHLGLDTHDPSDRNLPLEPGNVITVEPGLYFAKHNIGVRIEDNILVTKTGALNLSHEIPKELKDYLHA